MYLSCNCLWWNRDFPQMVKFSQLLQYMVHTFVMSSHWWLALYIYNELWINIRESSKFILVKVHQK